MIGLLLGLSINKSIHPTVNFYSPLFKYTLLINSDVFYLWNIEKGNAVNSFKEGSRDSWDQLRNDLFGSGGVPINLTADLSKDKTLRLWDILTGEELDCVHTLSEQSKLKFTPNDHFIAAFSRQEDRAYLREVRDSKLKLLSIFPKELGCNNANFKNAIDMDEEDKKLFEQLGGLNISK